MSEEPPVVHAWLVARGLSEQILVGTCFGARTLLSFADQVDQLRGLVLISTPVRDFERGAQTASLPTSEFVRQALTKKVLIGLRDPYRRRRYIHHLSVKGRGLLQNMGENGHSDSGLASRGFLDPLEGLVGRRTPMLMIYGGEDAYYREFRRARSGRLGNVLERAGDLITLDVIPGRFFGLPQLEVQRNAMESMEAWLTGLLAGAPVGTGSAQPT